jgi:hypothetical protein
MLDLRHIDPVVILVRTDPLDPNDALLEVGGNDEPVCVSLDVENDPFSADALTRFLDDERLCLSNNAAEREPACAGRTDRFLPNEACVKKLARSSREGKTQQVTW